MDVQRARGRDARRRKDNRSGAAARRRKRHACAPYNRFRPLRNLRAMSLDRVPAGRDVPNDCNVVVEIPMHGEPIKYEVDKETGAVFVDRFMSTAMRYPCNYGYIPQTLSDDGDPCDVLVVSPVPLITGVVVRCRPIGMLKMDDEAGGDSKILAVPIDRLSPIYRDVQSPRDLPALVTQQIAHFFEHYKDLEPGKWVKLAGWVEAEDAKREIVDSANRHKRAARKRKS
jgi:inorganic pyrophosphatase